MVKSASSIKESDPKTFFKSALPYSGTWIGDSRNHPVDKLVSSFIDAGYLETGLGFAKSHKKSFKSPEAYAEVFSQVGNRHADKGEFDTAISYYREALKEYQDSSLIHFNLALALERQQKQAEALQEYQRAIELDPKISVAHLNRGAILARNAKTLQQGIVSLKKAVALNPNLAASHYHLGMALERSRQFSPAFEHYRQALLLAPDHFGNAMQLAYLLERSGKIEEALIEYQKIARIHPKNPQAPFQSGMACEKLTRIGDAIAHYEASLNLSSQYLPALNNLAFILATSKEHGDPKKALKLATHAAQLTKFKHAAILDTLASAQLANNDKPGALTTLKNALALAQANQEAALISELSKKIKSLE